MPPARETSGISRRPGSGYGTRLLSGGRMPRERDLGGCIGAHEGCQRELRQVRSQLSQASGLPADDLALDHAPGACGDERANDPWRCGAVPEPGVEQSTEALNMRLGASTRRGPCREQLEEP